MIAWHSWNIGWPCDLLPLTNSSAFLGPYITSVNPELDRGFLLGSAPGVTTCAQLFLSWCVVFKDPELNKIQAGRDMGKSHRKPEPANLPGNPDLGCVKGASRTCVSPLGPRRAQSLAHRFREHSMLNKSPGLVVLGRLLQTSQLGEVKLGQLPGREGR